MARINVAGMGSESQEQKRVSPSCLIGCQFGRLTVVANLGQAGRSHDTRWLCRCSCGGEKAVLASHLKDGHVRSCGCLRRETNAIRNKENAKHGLSQHRLFHIWTGMKNRCLVPTSRAYRRYGGRGITVCDEWKSDFYAFYLWSIKNGYAEELTIDRIDNNGPYAPSNCRWTTIYVQANNKSICKYIEFNGETHTIAEWARILGFPAATLGRRLKNWDLETAMTKPLRGRVRHRGQKR